MWYTYDALSRVTKRTVKNACNTVVSEETYTYDAAGNITDAPDSCFGYGTNNRLTTFMERSVSYDADGNMLSARLGGTNMALSYDASNRLVSAGGHTYTYNAEDVRIRNVCNGYDTTYTYNTNGRLSQLLLKTTNGITTKYVYGLGLIGEEKCGEFKTYHFDYRGSTVALTDECGSITDTFEYDTYGNVTERTGDSFVIFGYNGRDGVVTDKNGLIYMRARYYSPEMRRFVNADILRGEISDSTSLNRYSYVNGNPVSFVDPFGLSKERGQGPSALEAAYMAQHIYGGNIGDESYGEWVLSRLLADENGFRIGLYERDINGVIEYTIVSKGSTTISDWVNNFLQPFGLSLDMWKSRYEVTKFVDEHPDAHITFVGHSKGGAEAIANAVATNKDAIVFNPATAYLHRYCLSTIGYTGNITSYVVQGEVLDSLSVVLGKNVGTEIPLQSPHNYDVNTPQWDSQLLGAQEPMAQLGQLIGGYTANFINANIEKHDIALVIELLNKLQEVNYDK